MPSTYIHLSGAAVKKALLRKHGLDQGAVDPTIVTCPRCNAPNEPNASTCVKCRSALRLEDAMTITDLHRRMKEQEEALDLVTKKLERLQVRSHPLTLVGGAGLTDEEVDKIIENKKGLVERLKEHGLVSEN